METVSNAIDAGDDQVAKTGKIIWQKKTKNPLICGVLATAGGLVFTGEGDGDFSAFDVIVVRAESLLPLGLGSLHLAEPRRRLFEYAHLRIDVSQVPSRCLQMATMPASHAKADVG